MNTLGMNDTFIVVGDADGLIALLHSDDVNHSIAVERAKGFVADKVEVLFPLTAIVEAATSLQRRLTNPPLVEAIRQQVIHGNLFIEDVQKDTLTEASKLFNPFGSKQNTLFDAVVATIAKRYQSEYIFSFDKWYTKQGFKILKRM